MVGEFVLWFHTSPALHHTVTLCCHVTDRIVQRLTKKPWAVLTGNWPVTLNTLLLTANIASFLAPNVDF